MAAEPVPPTFERYDAEEIATPAGSPGKNGVLELTLAPDSNGVTRPVREYVEVPFHLTRRLSHDPEPGLCTLCVQTPTGGVAQGDRHHTRIEAKNGTKAHVTAQSATKVQSMDANYAALSVDLEIESGAYLEYLPEPMILHEDTRCLQTTEVTLHDGGTFLFSDIVVPGRLARGERFAYDRYRSRFRVTDSTGRPVLQDCLDLAPNERSPETPGVFGAYAVVGSFYALEIEDCKELSDRIHHRLTDATGPAGNPTAHAGVTHAPDDRGVIVRVLGDRRAPVTGVIREAWAATRTACLGTALPEVRP